MCVGFRESASLRREMKATAVLFFPPFFSFPFPPPPCKLVETAFHYGRRPLVLFFPLFSAFVRRGECKEVESQKKPPVAPLAAARSENRQSAKFSQVPKSLF